MLTLNIGQLFVCVRVSECAQIPLHVSAPAWSWAGGTQPYSSDLLTLPVLAPSLHQHGSEGLLAVLCPV